MTIRRCAALMATVATAVLMIAAPALADHLEVVTSDTPTVEPGDTVEVAVVVRSSETQEPIPGASVIASIEADIVGVYGSVDIARATTDENGEAVLRWQIRVGTTQAAVLAYAEEGDAVIESQPLPIVTVGNDRQIVRSEAGVRIPGFGAWVLIALVVGIWATIQLALLGPVMVAAAESETEEGPEDP